MFVSWRRHSNKLLGQSPPVKTFDLASWATLMGMHPYGEGRSRGRDRRTDLAYAASSI